MSYEEAYEEYEERYFGGNYAEFCEEYDPYKEDCGYINIRDFYTWGDY